MTALATGNGLPKRAPGLHRDAWADLRIDPQPHGHHVAERDPLGLADLRP